MAMKRNVAMAALVTGVHSVVETDPRTGAGRRVTVVTNADEKADRANMDSDPRAISAYNLMVSESVAQQLEAKKIAKRVERKASEEGEAEGDAGPDRGPTVAETASRQVRENAEADAEGGDNISGADTRDSTAFARPPLTDHATRPADTAEAADADAPPAGDDADGEDKAKGKRKAPAKS